MISIHQKNKKNVEERYIGTCWLISRQLAIVKILYYVQFTKSFLRWIVVAKKYILISMHKMLYK